MTLGAAALTLHYRLASNRGGDFLGFSASLGSSSVSEWAGIRAKSITGVIGLVPINTFPQAQRGSEGCSPLGPYKSYCRVNIYDTENSNTR